MNSVDVALKSIKAEVNEKASEESARKEELNLRYMVLMNRHHAPEDGDADELKDVIFELGIEPSKVRFDAQAISDSREWRQIISEKEARDSELCEARAQLEAVEARHAMELSDAKAKVSKANYAAGEVSAAANQLRELLRKRPDLATDCLTNTASTLRQNLDDAKTHIDALRDNQKSIECKIDDCNGRRNRSGIPSSDTLALKPFAAEFQQLNSELISVRQRLERALKEKRAIEAQIYGVSL